MNKKTKKITATKRKNKAKILPGHESLLPPEPDDYDDPKQLKKYQKNYRYFSKSNYKKSILEI